MGLRANFQCADLICKFCGYLAQVKSMTLDDEAEGFPRHIRGAGWRPQHEQIIAGIYHGLFLVGFSKAGRLRLIDYVPADILRGSPKIFEPYVLGPSARRAGHPMFNYNLDELPEIGRKRVYPSA